MKLEVCVDNKQDLLAAVQAGADQIELCAALDQDGLTPDDDLLRFAFEQIQVPLKPMLRHRAGDFIYTQEEQKMLLTQLDYLMRFPFKSVVFGALTPAGEIDRACLELILEKLDGRYLCFHKAIDYTSDIMTACETLKLYEQVREVLSSGGCSTAEEGKEILKEMQQVLRPDQALIAAGKVRPENLNDLHQYLGLDYYHGRKIIDF